MLRNVDRPGVPNCCPQLMPFQDPLTRNFADLREVLNTVADLSDMSPNTFLGTENQWRPGQDLVSGGFWNG